MKRECVIPDRPRELALAIRSTLPWYRRLCWWILRGDW